jgi:hypothetical protein
MIMKDEAGYKRTLKRVDLLEQIVEQQAENISSLIRAIKLISARLPRAAGSCDPFDVTMMDRLTGKPYVLPPGLAEELSNPVHKWAIEKLSQEEAEIFHERTRLFWRMREMRSQREARKGVSVSCVKSAGGGAPAATHNL